MKRTTRAVAWLYERALYLYPRTFRQVYGREMRSVFALIAQEASRRGLFSTLDLCLRELYSLPGAVIHEHWRAARRDAEDATMTEWPKSGHVRDHLQHGPDAAPSPWTGRPRSWTASLAGLFPFLYIGLWSIVLMRLVSPPPLWQLIAYVGLLVTGYVAMLAGLGVGWARGFPRWSYAYVLCVPLFSLFVSIAAFTTILPYPYLLCLPLLSALIPLALMAIVVLTVTRSPWSLTDLFTNVWRDWTRLSFALYSLVPMVVWMAFDEVEDRFVLPFMVALMLILAGGALAYLRSVWAWQRVMALLVSAVLARVVATASVRIYWNTHPLPWMTGSPVRWYEILRACATSATLLLAFLFAPALLGLLRRWASPPRAA